MLFCPDWAGFSFRSREWFGWWLDPLLFVNHLLPRRAHAHVRESGKKSGSFQETYGTHSSPAKQSSWENLLPVLRQLLSPWELGMSPPQRCCNSISRCSFIQSISWYQKLKIPYKTGETHGDKQHGSIHTTICKIDSQRKLAVGLGGLKRGLCNHLEGW